mmetsp:Transcript_27635/g.88930  ORF Transcript_27635/g.88930 Transcript_27635/m.88930 type:complete len:333 (-) Transcript_27635:252-1250(-)
MQRLFAERELWRVQGVLGHGRRYVLGGGGSGAGEGGDSTRSACAFGGDTLRCSHPDTACGRPTLGPALLLRLLQTLRRARGDAAAGVLPHQADVPRPPRHRSLPAAPVDQAARATRGDGGRRAEDHTRRQCGIPASVVPLRSWRHAAGAEQEHRSRRGHHTSAGRENSQGASATPRRRCLCGCRRTGRVQRPGGRSGSPGASTGARLATERRPHRGYTRAAARGLAGRRWRRPRHRRLHHRRLDRRCGDGVDGGGAAGGGGGEARAADGAYSAARRPADRRLRGAVGGGAWTGAATALGGAGAGAIAAALARDARRRTVFERGGGVGRVAAL